MTVTVLRTGMEDGGDGPDHFADVEITDPTTGETGRFQCRNLFDFGYVVNPMYPLAPGRKPGGLARRTGAGWAWDDFDGCEWLSVRPMTDFEARAIEYLHRFPPIGIGVRL